MLHKSITLGDNHILHNWEVSSLLALQSLSVLSTDIGKVARRTDDNTFWILESLSGDKWKQLPTSAGSGSGSAVSIDTLVLEARKNFKLAMTKFSAASKIFSYQQLR